MVALVKVLQRVERFIIRFWYDQRAATTMEYALLLALVALAVIAVLGSLGGAIEGKIQEVINKLKGVGSDGEGVGQ